MKTFLLTSSVVVSLLVAGAAHATGVMTCKSGPRSGWKSQADLKAQLVKQGWKIRKIKVDGGCYEVYAVNEKGKRVESYFHPVTLKHLTTSNQDLH